MDKQTKLSECNEQIEKSHFPYPTPRKGQEEVLKRLRELIDEGFKVILFQAPTGWGKTPVNAQLCKEFPPSLYIVPQLSLIEQIVSNEYYSNWFVSLKGMDNYTCPKNGKRIRLGKCREEKNFNCEKETDCPYYLQKEKARNSKLVISDFPYFILEKGIKKESVFGKRKIIILDESHDLAQSFLSIFQTEVSTYSLPLSFCSKYFDTLKNLEGDQEIFRSFLCNAVKGAELTLKEKEEKSEDEIKDFNRLENMQNRLGLFDYIKNWKLEREDENILEWRIIALDSALLMPKFLWDKDTIYIISSATILDRGIFLEETGLLSIFKDSEISILPRILSEIPVKNNPIINATVGKANKAGMKIFLQKASDKIEEIMDANQDTRIAIHCHAYKHMNYLWKCFKKPYRNRLLWHNKRDRDTQLASWKTSKNKVFLSVGLEEGQDWKGCGAQVLLKVPYPNIRDPIVSFKMTRKNGNYWYQLSTLRSVIQAHGRVARIREDKSKFYVLDDEFEKLLWRTRHHIPERFKEALPKEWQEIVRKGTC